MQKAYNRIKWENYPSDETPLNETNLNKVDAAVDELDNRVIMHETTKATKTEVASLVQDVAFEESTGIFTIKKKNGAVLKIDTKLEKIAVNFAYNSTTQQIILTLIDGTKQYIDLSALITQYEFVDTATIGFEITSDGKVKATVLDGSITEDKLQPNYLADIKVEVAKAQSSATAAGKSEANAAISADTATTKATAAANSASAAKTSETNAKTSETNAGNSAQKAESYAVGGTGTRTGEDADNAKYYSQNASGSAETAKRSANTATARATDAANSATAAKTSETNAKTSETNAGNSASVASAKSTAAATSATNASASEKNASASANTASSKADAAATSATNASASEKNASASANTASSKADAAATSATNAANSASSASSSASSANTSKTNAASSAAAAASSAASAAKSATQADNYANGSTNSAKYYYEQAKNISESISGTLKPMGTVTFANLPVLSSSATGDMYNISNEFTTTSDFKEGAGNVIPAGANIYKTSDGKWDVLAGSPVTGVKGNAESSYRRGNVNITLPSLGVSATAAELNCMSGVTGNVQAQLDNTGKRYFHAIYLADTNVYNEDTYYPVTADLRRGEGYNHLVVAVELTSGSKPSWSTHECGFTCNLDMLIKASGRGTTNGHTICLDNSYGFSAESPVGYCQLYNTSKAVLYLRGGGNYFIYTDWNASFDIHATAYTVYGETVAPVTAYPGVSFQRSTITANLDGVASGNVLTTGGMLSGEFQNNNGRFVIVKTTDVSVISAYGSAGVEVVCYGASADNGLRAAYGFQNANKNAAALYLDTDNFLKYTLNNGEKYTLPITPTNANGVTSIRYDGDALIVQRHTVGWERVMTTAMTIPVANGGTGQTTIPKTLQTYFPGYTEDVGNYAIPLLGTGWDNNGHTSLGALKNALGNGTFSAENIVATADTESRIGQYSIRNNTIQNTTTDVHLMACDDSHTVYTHGAYLGVCKIDGSWTYVCASAFSNQSSRRYKDNIEDMTDEEALKVLRLRPVKYDYIRREDGTDCYGVIAEEADEIMHYPVIYDSEGRPDGVDYSRFVPYLIKTVQIQQQEIDALRGELAEIKERIADFGI